MNELTLIQIGESDRLGRLLTFAAGDLRVCRAGVTDTAHLAGARVIFPVHVDAFGAPAELHTLLRALRSGSQLQQMLTIRLPRRQAGQIRFAYRKRPYQWQLITAFLHTARTTVQPS